MCAALPPVSKRSAQGERATYAKRSCPGAGLRQVSLKRGQAKRVRPEARPLWSSGSHRVGMWATCTQVVQAKRHVHRWAYLSIRQWTTCAGSTTQAPKWACSSLRQVPPCFIGYSGIPVLTHSVAANHRYLSVFLPSLVTGSRPVNTLNPTTPHIKVAIGPVALVR